MEQENIETLGFWEDLGREYGGQVVCAWCDTHLRFDNKLEVHEISHGMCDECCAVMLADVERGQA